MTEQQNSPSKNDRVLYHDPLSGEACAAIVVKVHPNRAVNLVFWTEEGASNSKTDVPWGPGMMEHWWFPHEDGPKGDWAE